MPMCYNKLWKMLIDRNLNKTDLKENSGISFNVLARMGKNEPISMESIEKICVALNCNVGDIMEIIDNNKLNVKSFSIIELFAGFRWTCIGN